MLQIIDQRWQDHLAEMDYLREGINLRAMGNQDPLVAYQREGFAMFGKLMDGINDDYLRYVFHVQVLAEPAAEPDLDRASYLAADDPVQGDGAITAAFAAASPAELEQAAAVMDGGNGNGTAGGVTNRVADDGETQLPIVKSDREKIGRNDPCWCGSGKKFKFCHGAN
jgi:preprotein translocase subunit SecA